MMHTIAIANQKGGVGKTTTAIYLSFLSNLAQTTTLIDSDSQASSAEWWEELSEPKPQLIEAPSPRTLRAALSRAADSNLTIIDTPPGNPEVAVAALEAATTVIIPTRAGILEVGRVALMLKIIPEGIPRYLLLTASSPRTRAHRETVQAWEQAGEKIIGSIRQRVSIASDLRLDPLALEEYKAVLDKLST